MSDYDTNIDVDGDGHFDEVDFTENADGSVTITADMNDDGRNDFIGHDADSDGIVESAQYDDNLDGHFDTEFKDTDGDGYLDVSSSIDHGSDTAGPSGTAAAAAPVPGGGAGGYSSYDSEIPRDNADTASSSGTTGEESTSSGGGIDIPNIRDRYNIDFDN